MLMSHEELTSYMQTNFALIKFHNYTLEDLENMVPWEREVYIILVENWIKEQNDQARDRASKQRGK
jgi:hypothetical protein